MTHALLSASSAHRWLACPPSMRLCLSYEDVPSTFAQEGTDAHALAQYMLEKALGLDSEDPTGTLSYYSEEMKDHAENYAAFVMEELQHVKETCKDPLIFIEQKLDFSEFVPEGYGFVDCLIIADGTLTVIDYKYGLGVKVSAENNPQMFCYALGGLGLFDAIYDIDTVKMIIYQPRRENISEHSISRDELLSWAKDILAPTAQLAFAGEGEFTAGEHCRFCKARATCRKLSEYNMELAKDDFDAPATLSPSEISKILVKADELINWVNDVKEYALKEALKGTKFTGFKLVEGRSNRKYTDEAKVAEKVVAAGKDPYEKKILGITAMTTLLGKKKFEELLGGLIQKPPGKPTLVTVDDKREELSTAINDFDGGNENE